ncbi:site-specific integrase [Siphonobacter sp. SORGH_AS_0500]|uniref:site-specific integrase n=1 Tax=Siphonobacter sp. SORGH_AS_0500 TaxID=1864824 RepID=UPI0028554F25|nr:site-specific integrase [Siphonobacter sp. SORGH_AS_0500]MDR6194939.1 integrase [Siphonobacter sp. SORGH_AS_0500]
MSEPTGSPSTKKSVIKSSLIRTSVELGSKPKKNGRYPLFLRITQDRKLKRIYLGYDIAIKDWNSEKKEVRRSEKMFAVINRTIEDKIAEVAKLKQELKHVNASTIAENLYGKATESFFDFAYTYIEKQSYNTQRNLKNEVNKLLEFTQNRNLLFADLSLQMLEGYQSWLKTVRKNSQSTVRMSLVKIQTIVNHAIEKKILPVNENPFLGLKTAEGKPTRVRLTDEELQRFAAVELEPDSLLWHTRNYWMFAYYAAGVRFSDLTTLKWKNIEDGRLTYIMRKTAHVTDKAHSIQLPKKALDILGYYTPKIKRKEDYLFPILNISKVLESEFDLLKEISSKNAMHNLRLKKICKKAEIEKEVSFHSARHTFADLGRRKIKDVYAVSKLLRHSKISMTEKYLNSFDTDTVDQAMKDLFD